MRAAHDALLDVGPLTHNELAARADVLLAKLDAMIVRSPGMARFTDDARVHGYPRQ